MSLQLQDLEFDLFQGRQDLGQKVSGRESTGVCLGLSLGSSKHFQVGSSKRRAPRLSSSCKKQRSCGK